MKTSIDFSFEQYVLLIKSMQNKQLPIIPFKDYLQNKPQKFVIMRHDVDRMPFNALKMAEAEHQLGVRSTYYFRFKPSVYNVEIIKKISDLGHEIGYHYETLSDCKGDYEKAIRSFNEIIGQFRMIVEIETISMHGSPLSKYNNQWLWEKYNYSDYGIKGEPYFSIDYSKVTYFTDAGRLWNAEKVNFRDKVETGFQYNIKCSDDIINLLNSGNSPTSFIINVHPENWALNKLQWYKTYFWRGLKNKVKLIIHLIDKRN